MGRWTALFASLLAGVAFALPASALVVTHVFTGTITTSSIGGINVGDPFTATLEYDTSQPPVFTVATQQRYAVYSFELVTGSFTFNEDPNSTLKVVNDHLGLDDFSTEATNTGFAGFALDDSTGSVFNSTALPLSLCIADFDSNFVAVGGGSLVGNITGVDPCEAPPVPCVGMDFEPLMHDDALEADHAPALGGRYKQNGFQVIHHIGSVLLNTYGKQHVFFSGSTAMHGTSSPLAAAGSFTVIDAPAAAPPLGYLFAQTTFTPFRVLLTERDNATPAGTSVTFTGYFPDNSTVMQTVSLDGNLATNELFLLQGFEGIKYLEWPMIQQIDDICVLDPCADGLDNDGDGQTDGDDPDCMGIGAPGEHLTASPPSLPLLGGVGLGLLAGGLVGLGALAAGRTTRRSS